MLVAVSGFFDLLERILSCFSYAVIVDF